jgi:hypothetical protein
MIASSCLHGMQPEQGLSQGSFGLAVRVFSPQQALALQLSESQLSQWALFSSQTTQTR